MDLRAYKDSTKVVDDTPKIKTTIYKKPKVNSFMSLSASFLSIIFINRFLIFLSIFLCHQKKGED